ncbi:hypothetical protein [Bradyrhizobium sp. STM 3557]|uniref:hypothetical protein n=1 Tax=Bradyrhizobium sp. STM 3557 TaxID=578920 RepID=UPI00388D1D57
MKLVIGAVSATLLVAATAGAQAEPLVSSGASASPLYRTVSDIDEPYYSEAPPPPPAPVPPPAPRYGYGPGPDYGYRPPAPVYGPDAYRPEPYRPDYGYAPAFLPVRAVYAIARDNGFSPLGEPRQRGYTYVISVLDRDGEDGRLLIDARSGRIIRFVPAFQWGEQYERMRYEPGRERPAPIMPRASLDSLPPPTVIKADPHLLQAAPAAPVGPQMASRAMPAPKPAVPATRPAAPAPQTAAVQPRPAAAPQQVPAEQKPAPQILPTEKMPPAQGLE